ncbi:MAG: hydrogenase maturation nickel metallochaperone HypA [Dehalococcoidales bacterium]|nr:hydrogenase maturation nickel metallochaperone HypA [Dehalococcoidales bacterium]
MHEMTITRSLVDITLEEAGKANATKVTSVSIVLGEMSGAVDQSVEFYFELMTRDTIAEGAKINFRKVPNRAKCRKCGNIFKPGGIFWECDKCHSMEMEIISGRELYVESIEVD